MVEIATNMNENQHWETFDNNEKGNFWKRSEFECDKSSNTDEKINGNSFENDSPFVASFEESEFHKECEFPESEISHSGNPIKDICVNDGENYKQEAKIDLEIESLALEEFEYLSKKEFDSVISYSNEINHIGIDEIEDIDECLLGKSSELKSLKALFDSRSSDGSDVEHLSHQIKHPKTITESPTENSPNNDSNKGISVLSYNSKTDSSTITFDFNSIKIESENTDNNDKTHEQSPKLRNGSPINSSKILNNLADEKKVQKTEGESSFSMVGPLSGIISHSGSISIRSDSSTTSARSFAFPILPNEWNCSPVRMAKADKRRYRSAKSWKNGLFCCRF